MNEIRTMVDQSHRLCLAQSRSVTPSDKCHPTRVTGSPTGSFQNAVEFPVGMIVSELVGPSNNVRECESIMPVNRLQEGCKMLTHRDGEVFPRVSLLTFRIFQKNGQSFEVDILFVDPRLVEPASEVDQDLKTDSAPFFLRPSSQEFNSSCVYILVTQLQLFFRGLFGNNFSSEHISISYSFADSFFHQERKEFDFSPGSIVRSTGLFPKCHVFLGVLMLQLFWMVNLSGKQPARQVAPKVNGTHTGFGFLIMMFDIGRYPIVEIISSAWTDHCLFFAFLGCLFKSCGSVFWIIMPEFQVLSFPRAVIQVAEPTIPKGTSISFYQVGHEKKSCTQLHKLNDFQSALKCSISLESVISTQGEKLPLHHRANDACI